jgi:hypothetical protein
MCFSHHLLLSLDCGTPLPEFAGRWPWPDGPSSLCGRDESRAIEDNSYVPDSQPLMPVQASSRVLPEVERAIAGEMRAGTGNPFMADLGQRAMVSLAQHPLSVKENWAITIKDW